MSIVEIIKEKGFSLVELSVVLVVIGITISGALTIATKKNEADKVAETEFKIAQIELAIENFIIENDRIPCTADGTLRTNNANFAREVSAPTLNSGNGQCGQSNFSNANIFYGIVPTRTLGLDDDILLDGWGNRFSYVVDANFAHNDTTNSSCNGGVGADEDICFQHNANGTIEIIHSNGPPVIDRTTEAVYAIISHGKNGSGAYSNTGSKITILTDADELENSGDDEGAFDITFVQKDKTRTFDDILVYKRKWQILTNLNYIYDGSLCNETSDALTKCAGAADTLACQDIFEQIENWCLG